MRVSQHNTVSYYNYLWDAFCVASIIGIWPRFIEPNQIWTTHLTLPLQNLPSALQGFKILQFSDLHLNNRMSDRFLNKLSKKIRALKADLIVFTGDFICHSTLDDQERLKEFLCQCEAPYGCYAVLGNHDYSEYVSVDEEGAYDIMEDSNPSIIQGFRRLFTTTILTKTIKERVKKLTPHPGLIQALAKTPFQLLHNTSIAVSVKEAVLNIFGCGEYMLGHCKPQDTFHTPHTGPSIVLVHNPDAIPHLADYPADLILCGHTHGGHVNLPGFWKKLTFLENQQFKKGSVRYGNKRAYINRGIGGILPFRWFSPPELLLLTLSNAS